MEEEKLFESEITSLKELINEKFDRNDSDHLSIIEQTKKTNGSVAKAICDIDSLKGWKSFMMGGLTIISMFLIPIIVYLAVNINSEIKELQDRLYVFDKNN